jgi:hypothetical protein
MRGQAQIMMKHPGTITVLADEFMINTQKWLIIFLWQKRINHKNTISLIAVFHFGEGGGIMIVHLSSSLAFDEKMFERPWGQISMSYCPGSAGMADSVSTKISIWAYIWREDRHSELPQEDRAFPEAMIILSTHAWADLFDTMFFASRFRWY